MKREPYTVAICRPDEPNEEMSVLLTEEEAELVRLLATDLPSLRVEAAK